VDCPLLKSVLLGLDLVVVVVRNNETLALEEHAMAAAVWTRIADEAVLNAVEETVGYSEGSATCKANRTTSQAAGGQFIGSIFFAEVTCDHFGATDGTFDPVLKRRSAGVPNGGDGHAHQPAWEILNFVPHPSRLWSLRIGKSWSRYGTKGEPKHRQC
jgi:hypothetical protein